MLLRDGRAVRGRIPGDHPRRSRDVGPGQDGPHPRRPRPAARVAGSHSRRHGGEAGRATASSRRREVSGARREHSRGRLRGGARRRRDDALRQPAGRAPPRLSAGGVAATARHLDGAAAHRRPGADARRLRPPQRDRRALEPRISPHRQRRQGRLVPGRGHARARRERPTAHVAGRQDGHHRPEASRGSAAFGPRRPGAARAGSNAGAGGRERAHDARGPRAPARRGGAPRCGGEVPVARRAPARRELHLGPQSAQRALGALYQPADRGTPRLHRRGVEFTPTFWLECVHPDDRDRVLAAARGRRRRAPLQHRVSLPRQGRAGGLGGGRSEDGAPHEGRSPTDHAGADGRHHRAQGGRGAAAEGGGPGPDDGRAASRRSPISGTPARRPEATRGATT